MMKVKDNGHGKSYLSIWMLLATALAVILVVAFADDISVSGYTVKKAPFREHLLGESLADSLPPLVTEEEVDNLAEVASVDTLPQTLFIFGDSMTFNLALRLAQYARQNGHTIYSINWDSSNTKIWAEHDTLGFYIRKYHPTQIFISLGSNELYFKDPSSRLPYVKKILEVIDTIPYVWIGPPNWKEDTGINDMIERACRRGSFFRSAGMKFERKADHIHPTRKSSALWIDSVMRWIPRSAHPFLVEPPADSIGKANPHILFIKALNK